MNQFHDDTFTLNDITFTVPPLEIRIDKEAANFSWQTLRTRNAQKVKSGHGVINISFSAVFVGEDAINNQLRLLIAQLKLTPICYAENTFLRQSLLPDIDDQSLEPAILLILKSLTITVQPELKDTVVAHFQFSWFNYSPYTARVSFNSDITLGVPTPQSTPEKSLAWKKFYKAEMGEFNGNAKYLPIRNLNSSFSLIYNLLAVSRDKIANIQYKNSGFVKNNFTVFTAETSVDCNPESGFVVTGITISFENIVAALPVLGHQYMTYQHIGSVDPRIMVRIMTTNDTARGEISSMWKTVEQNAIEFRHIPQEFLNVKIANQITQLCGLSTFITESLTEETIPGQPGTFALNLTLKGTDYLKTKERFTQEFVTNQDVRDSIISTINRYLTTDGTGIIIPKTTADKRNARLHAVVKKVADTTNDLSRTIGRSFGDVQFDEDRGIIEAFVRSTTDKIIFSSILRKSFEERRAARPLYTQEQRKFEKFNAVARNAPVANRVKPVLDRLQALIDQWINEITTFADLISQDGTLDLPEFAEARKLAEKTGVFQGHSAYPDFPALQSLAESEGRNPLDLNPSFYFYDSITDTAKSMIDPGYLVAAEQASRSLYTDNDSTNPNGNLINKASNFVEEVYKNRFEPDSSTRKSIDNSKADISTFFSRKKESNMKIDTARDISYRSALDSPRPMRSSGFGIEALSQSPGKEGTETPVQCPGSIEHHGNFEAIFDKNARTYKPSENRAYDIFINPIGPGTFVTSPFGPRSPKNPEASRNHRGIDLSAAVGTSVLASSAGVVQKAGLQDPSNDKIGWGNHVHIAHRNGFHTIYAHLSEISVKEKAVVNYGDVLGKSGGAGGPGSGNSTEAHLHFEVWDPQSIAIDPKLALDGSIWRDNSSGEGFQFGSSIFARSLESISDDLLSGQGPSMKRAYPTFKLYFIEEDFEERIFGFDDFFNYNSVKSIRVVRSRKIPADLCVIELTNISGILSNRKFQHDFNSKGMSTGDKSRNNEEEIIREATGKDGTINPLLRNTAKENPIASMMLQEGIKILLKLGYDNNPDKLENVFVGQIVEVEFNDTDDLVTIVCQSYATELTQQIKGLEKPEALSGWFLGTNDAVTTRLLSSMLYQPEVLHFGRWKRSRANGVKLGFISTDKGSNTNLDILTNKYEWNVRPQDDNIFAPLVSSDKFKEYFSVQETDGVETSIANFMIDWIGVNKSFNLNFINYYIYKTTIWEIFKEMELRHPGCISSPVPYMDARMGPRMTMFFGMPNQLYFARDPNFKENAANWALVKTVKDNTPEYQTELAQIAALNDLPTEPKKGKIQKVRDVLLGIKEVERRSQVIKDKQEEVYLRTLRMKAAIKNKSIRPFRSYHVLTSNNHIIENNIRTSSLGVFNTVSIEYKRGFLEGLKEEGIKSAAGNKKIFRLKADAGLPDEEVQEAFLSYESCEGKTMAEFYGLGALKQTLRDIYKGEITIIGNPSIKPYDICYVFDEYSDMVGPVEVEQVIHYFSQETGFITEITPDICVSINEWTTMGTMDAIGLVVEDVLDRHYGRKTRKEQDPSAHIAERVGKLAGVSLPILLNPGALPLLPILTSPITPVAGAGLLVGAFVANKLVHWSKYRHPITFSPLLHKGKPFMAAMSSKVINANWYTNFTGDSKNPGWFKDGFTGAKLIIGDIVDSAVIGAGTGSISNIGVNSEE